MNTNLLNWEKTNWISKVKILIIIFHTTKLAFQQHSQKASTAIMNSGTEL